LNAEPASAETAVSPWAGRRQRAEALRARHPFAAEPLTLYLALLPVQEEAWAGARESPPAPDELPRWAAARVVPPVLDATVAAGPATLAQAAHGRLAEGAAGDALAGWLAGAELDPVDQYLARASLGPVLEALGDQAGAACSGPPGRDGGQACPCCGGLPRLSCIASTGEALVSGSRSLLCARCATSWGFSRSVCPACGESGEEQLQVFAEHLEGPVSGRSNGNGDGHAQPVFPHLRIAACATCSRYLIEVDMERDARAVPEVDELAALPLDLYAADEGLTKVTPNLMGF
jgi:Protein involved in formate dehydrogenase formation